MEEIAHFFVAYKKREGHDVEAGEWHPREQAERVIRDARARFGS